MDLEKLRRLALEAKATDARFKKEVRRCLEEKVPGYAFARRCDFFGNANEAAHKELWGALGPDAVLAIADEIAALRSRVVIDPIEHEAVVAERDALRAQLSQGGQDAVRAEVEKDGGQTITPWLREQIEIARSEGDD